MRNFSDPILPRAVRLSIGLGAQTGNVRVAGWLAWSKFLHDCLWERDWVGAMMGPISATLRRRTSTEPLRFAELRLFGWTGLQNLNIMLGTGWRAGSGHLNRLAWLGGKLGGFE